MVAGHSSPLAAARLPLTSWMQSTTSSASQTEVKTSFNQLEIKPISNQSLNPVTRRHVSLISALHAGLTARMAPHHAARGQALPLLEFFTGGSAATLPENRLTRK